ncbi:MAG: DUF1016 family protein [Bacteroidales bacterium]|nr:DUF1016 family protein [Bacteroidales bacterium]
MQQLLRTDYIEAVKTIKEAIQQSRYRAAKLVNSEVLGLYYAVGRYISSYSRKAQYGSNALRIISDQLQREMPGLKGFSEASMKRMRKFYEGWSGWIENRPPAVDDLDAVLGFPDYHQIVIRPLTVAEFTGEQLHDFLSVPFIHHYEILVHTNTLEERLFYIRECATHFWSKDFLIGQLKADLFHKGVAQNNFQTAIPDTRLRDKAMRMFREDVVMDFLHIPDPDDVDERDVERQIVENIKNFIMSLGGDFAFMGNQYRVIVEGEESFIDLLFYNRRLRSLVAIELKGGKFKPEYVGKMNYYLSALDEYVRLPEENPSIGIILCRSVNEKKVEFSFRDLNKPVGVATYHSSTELPEAYKNILPSAEELRKLL